jgi:lysophospholipid acyltransferase (LPLAT)-like uncharacterized protein
MKTWRGRWRDAAQCPVTPGPVIYCVWHNRLPLTLASYDDFARSRWPAAGLAAMVSASRDGGMLASVVAAFGVEPIRGSTSRRGPQALLEATSWLEKNYSVAMTPDGPRGPVYQIQEGIISLAQLSGRPIIPVSNFAQWKIRLRSWDRFQIPLPFSRCEYRYGKPIWVARDVSEEQRKQFCAELQEAMLGITRD